MPFKSEKQRRFLWAAHPDIAKRWAHEYPESNKGLPMYARKKKTEKEAALTAISRYVNKLNNLEVNLSTGKSTPISKNANSKQVYIEVPHSEKPTYAGEEKETEQKNDTNENGADTVEQTPKNKQQNAINALLKKVALVVAPGIKRMKEKQDAAAEGREPAYIPENQDVKHYPVATPGIMPPIGMQQQPAQAQPQQPQSRPSAPPVGNGSTPQSRPIQSFGGLDVNNKLTGNSGLAGGRNPGKALKQSSALPDWYGAEALMQEPDGKINYGVYHGVDIRDKAPGFLGKLFGNSPYVLRNEVQDKQRRLQKIKGLHAAEIDNELRFWHYGGLTPKMQQLIDAALTAKQIQGKALKQASWWRAIQAAQKR